MRPDQIERVFRKLGSYKFVSKDKGVATNCPFYFKHQNRSDSYPSMFIFATDPRSKDFSFATCHACSWKGSIEKLLWDLKQGGTPIPMELFTYVQDAECGMESLDDLINLPKYQEIPNYVRNNKRAARSINAGKKVETKQIVLHDNSRFDWVQNGKITTTLPKEVLEKMVAPCLGKVPAYWTERGFSQEDAKHWNVGTQESLVVFKKSDKGQCYLDFGKRLLFPIYDFNKTLVGWSARSLNNADKKSDWIKSQYPTGDLLLTSVGFPKYFHCPVFTRNDFLYGEHLVDRSVRIGILTEGFFDVINLTRLGYKNVLASMGTHLSETQMGKILGWFDTLYVFPDGDEAGINAAKTIKEKFKDFKKISIRVVDCKIYEGRDPGDLTLEETMDCLDFII